MGGDVRQVNVWEIGQTVFVIYVILLVFCLILSGLMAAEYPHTAKRVILGTITFVTLIVLIGGFLYYKNVETKCMHDKDFSGACLDKDLT
jgi:hypothetical protein